MRMPTMVKGSPSVGSEFQPGSLVRVKSNVGRLWVGDIDIGLDRLYSVLFPLFASSSTPRFWMKAPVVPASVANTLIA
jgi:hypothetical protein